MPAFLNRPGVRSSMKAAVIVIMLLLLLIPLTMIRQLVRERETLADTTTREIIDGAGGRLDFYGPLLILPYDVIEDVYRGDEWVEVRRRGGEVYLVPDAVSVTMDLETEYRSRGIYRVPIYRAGVSVDGRLPEIDPSVFPEGAIPMENEFRLFAGFSDMRGIQSVSDLVLESRNLEFHPGSGPAFLQGGISASLEQDDAGSFSWTMEINGGGYVSVTPLGRDSRFSIAGDWPSPSFGGSVLPSDRELDDDGFSASWIIPEVSRPLGVSWDSNDEVQPLISDYSLTVKLMEPVGTYARSLRSVKYGALFLLLPFVVFFLFEAFGKARIHPVQYLLAGCADVLFYLLLLAVSEHLGFDPAYLIAAGASTLLLSLYSLQVTGRTARALVMPVVLGGAYLWLWVTLQSEDYALLIGAGGLFALVGLVMLVTRKVDWYAAGGGPADSDAVDEELVEGDFCPEGQERQPGEFDMLPAEGDSDDGDGE